MQASRYVALIHPDTMAEARRLGMMNFSGFVNEQIKEYIAARTGPAKNRSENRDGATPLKELA